jgi:hypothetical protein
MDQTNTSTGTAQIKPLAYESAYPGSMFRRADGSYVERTDNASLAAALLENIAALGRRAEDADDAEKEVKQLREQRDELLAALKRVMSWVDNWSPNFTEDEEWPADRDSATAVIARVEAAQ